MIHRKRLALVAALCVSLYARDAGAEEPAPVPVPWHLKNGGTVTTPKGNVLELPPGYYLAEPTWTKLDTELRRSQDAETRLAAENQSLRSGSEGMGWRSASVIATIALVTGMIAGVVAY